MSILSYFDADWAVVGAELGCMDFGGFYFVFDGF